MKNIKLVLTDMDGTLLDSNKNLPSNFFEMLEKLDNKGIKFSVASGRGYASLRETFEKVADDIYFITDNGTIIYYQDKCLFSDKLNPNTLKYVYDKFINTTSRVIYCGVNGSYCINEDSLYLEHAKMYYTTLKAVKSLDEIDDTICKIAIYNDNDAKDEIIPLLSDLPDGLNAVYSSYNWVDISNQNVSKGSALNHLQDILNVSFDETMAFGDFDNDIELLRNSYYSYAMANATDNVKAVARFQTLSNDENGVMIILSKVVD